MQTDVIVQFRHVRASSRDARFSSVQDTQRQLPVPNGWVRLTAKTDAVLHNETESIRRLYDTVRYDWQVVHMHTGQILWEHRA